MNAVPIHVLVLEDSPTDALLLRVALERDLLDQFALTIVERLEEGISQLAHTSFDVIVLDLGLPDSQGLKTFESLHPIAPHIPTIVFSGNTDDKDAIQAVRAGAQDYLVKSVSSFEMAGRAIRHAIERHKLQKSLQESEARFATIFEYSPVAIGISRIRDQKLIHVNTAFMALYGLSRAEALGHTTEELNIWVNLDDRRRFIEQLQTHKKVIGFETLTYNSKIGVRRNVLVSGEIMEIDGELCRVVQIIDITERKQNEQIIQETNAKLAHAQSLAHLGSWDDYLPTGELSWSDEMYRIMGFPLHTPVRLAEIMSVFPPDELKRFQEALHTSIHEGRPYSMDYRIVRHDGTERYIHDEGEVVRDENGVPLWMRGTTQDITERKLIEETLIKNQQLLHEAQGIARLGSWTSYIQAGMYDASPECARILGWEAGLHPLQDLFDTVHPDDRLKMETTWESALQGGDFEIEHRILVRGQTQWVHVKAQIRFDPEGKPLFALGITQDITRRKKAEDALRASEERYRLIAQYVDDIVWQLNPQLQFVFTSPATERVLGYTVEEALKMNVAEIIDAEGLRQMREVIHARLSGDPHAHRPSEYKMRHKDGHWVDVEVVSAPVFDSQNNLLGFVGVTRQVTERKQAELALRASEEKYRTLALELEDRVQKRTAEVQDLYENAPNGY
ncbi:MAG TPA: PAS domain S-box protein, partial [Anaerolineales bacterium]|nr:PAS domain S-box protein [Anaerolineales bacterium]